MDKELFERWDKSKLDYMDKFGETPPELLLQEVGTPEEQITETYKRIKENRPFEFRDDVIY